VLAGAGPLYRGRLEALWSCLESMLLDGDLEVGGGGQVVDRNRGRGRLSIRGEQRSRHQGV
jgi:hypothetical protein